MEVHVLAICTLVSAASSQIFIPLNNQQQFVSQPQQVFIQQLPLQQMQFQPLQSQQQFRQQTPAQQEFQQGHQLLPLQKLQVPSQQQKSSQEVQQQQQQQVLVQQQQRNQQYIPIIGPLGVPIETKEVQAAKAVHFDIYNRQRLLSDLSQQSLRNANKNGATNINSKTTPGNNNPATKSENVQNQSHLYPINNRLPNAQQLIATNLISQDTPEVSAAKVQHFQIYARQAALADPNNTNKLAFQIRYTAPPVLTLQQIQSTNSQPIYRQRRSIYSPVTGKNSVATNAFEIKLAREQYETFQPEAKKTHKVKNLEINSDNRNSPQTKFFNQENKLKEYKNKEFYKKHNGIYGYPYSRGFPSAYEDHIINYY